MRSSGTRCDWTQYEHVMPAGGGNLQRPLRVPLVRHVRRPPPVTPARTAHTSNHASMCPRPSGVMARCMQRACTLRFILARRTATGIDAWATCREYIGITRCPLSSFPFPHLSPRRRAPRFCCQPYHPPGVLCNLFLATLTTLNAKGRRHIEPPAPSVPFGRQPHALTSAAGYNPKTRLKGERGYAVDGERIDTAGRVERMGPPSPQSTARTTRLETRWRTRRCTPCSRTTTGCASGSRDSSAPACRSGVRSCPRSPTTR